jgi:hypothetical protein
MCVLLSTGPPAIKKQNVRMCRQTKILADILIIIIPVTEEPHGEKAV